jgi:hypothetical protein
MTTADDAGRRRVAPVFTEHPIPDDELMAQQGIAGPQGLSALGYPDWDDLDEAHLAALTET